MLGHTDCVNFQRLMLLFVQELLEYVDSLMNEFRVESLTDLVQGLTRLPLMLLGQDGVLGAIKPEELLLILILKLVNIDVWLGPYRHEIENAWLLLCTC